MKSPEYGKVFTPQCRMVALDLIRKIRNGEFGPGKRMDSIRKIAERYRVGYQVAVSAFRILSNENYVFKVHGSGTYVNPDLRPGLFHRLSLFFNVTNFLPLGDELRDAFAYAEDNGFHLLPASNFEEDFTLEDYLKRKTDIDGIVIYGEVDEALLEYPKAHRVKYVVCGNYDIAATHPQVILDVRDLYRKMLGAALRKNPFRRVAVLMDLPLFRASGEALEGIRDAFRDVGSDLSRERIVEAAGDGYDGVAKIMKMSPDAILVRGDRHAHGLLRYFQNHPLQDPPAVLAAESVAGKLRAGGYPNIVELKSGRFRNIFLESVEYLIRELRRKEGRRTHTNKYGTEIPHKAEREGVQ